MASSEQQPAGAAPDDTPVNLQAAYGAMDAAGVILEEGEEESEEARPVRVREKKGNSLKNYSLEDLEEMLNEVIGREDYEKAARIRDEINRREQGV